MRPPTASKSRCSVPSSTCSDSLTKRRVVGCCGCRNTRVTGPVSTIWPASSTATRSQTRRITSISWVISTMVRPSSRLIFDSSDSTEAVVCGSSALVASSHSRICGRVASARAMPTRCFWPPDSCAGYFCACASRPTVCSSSATRASISVFGVPASSSGKATLPATVREDSRLKCWKIMPMRRRSARRPSASSAVTSSPPISSRPPLGSSRRLIMRIRVDLPAPEWPMMPNTSPASMVRSNGCRALTSRPATA